MGEDLFRVVLGEILADERLGRLDDLSHALLDTFEVIGSERPPDVEVVVEAIRDRRSDGVPRSGEEITDRLCHHVRGRMAQDLTGLVGGGWDLPPVR